MTALEVKWTRWGLAVAALMVLTACSGGDDEEGESSLVGRWYAYSIGFDGERRPDSHAMRVTEETGPDAIRLGAVELRADGTLTSVDAEVYGYDVSTWGSFLLQGEWNISDDGRLNITVFNDSGSFEYGLDGNVLSVRDARGELFRYERINEPPQLTTQTLTGLRGYSVNAIDEAPYSVDGLPGDCPRCAQTDLRVALAFNEDNTVDLIRVHASDENYAYKTTMDNRVGVCAGSFPWSLNGGQLSIDLPSGTVTNTVFLGRASTLLFDAEGDVRLDALDSEYEPVVQVCSAVGPPPAGSDPLLPDTWDDPVLIRTYDVCAPEDELYTLSTQGAFNYWVAGRVELPNSAFEVDQISYNLRAPEQACTSLLAHRVAVFVGNGTTPPDNPTFAYDAQVPANNEELSLRPITLAVTPAVRVEANQSLFVAIQIAGGAFATLCVQGCDPQSNGLSGRAFFSSTESTAPQGWTSYDTVGGIALDFSVRGRAAD